jgi:hypothetical protein
VKASDFAGWLAVTAEANGWDVHEGDLGAAFPCLLLARGPELVAAHVKAATKTELTPAQQRWARALALAGAEAVCWNPNDMSAAYTRLTKGTNAWNGQGTHVEQSEPVS